MMTIMCLSPLWTQAAWTRTTPIGFPRRRATGRCSRQLLCAHVTAIESTPNPSSFLLQLAAPLEGLEDLVGSLRGRSYTTTAIFPPTDIAAILALDGIDSVYAMAAALTVNKQAAASWDVVLPLVLQAIDASGNHQELLQGLAAAATSPTTTTTTTTGQVRIRLQISNRMPIQIEGIGCLGTTRRKALAPKFVAHMEELVEGGAAFFANRQWVDRGVRYILREDEDDDDAAVMTEDATAQEDLDLDTLLQAEYDDYEAAYSGERLAAIVAQQLGHSTEDGSPPSSAAAATAIPASEMDLERVQQTCDLAEEGNLAALTVLADFVQSHQGNMAARRDALAYLGGTGAIFPGHDLVLEAVVSALQEERNPIMRRTAGDALSDLGDSRAVPYAMNALTDRSKLVQWRAARIVGELGDSMETVAVLKEASFSSDYAFEVAFEIKDAMRKVRERALNKDAGGDGGPGAGPIWKQIQDGMAEKSSKSE
jgi:hypothetical protein